jgi:hypothetical protein
MGQKRRALEALLVEVYRGPMEYGTSGVRYMRDYRQDNKRPYRCMSCHARSADTHDIPHTRECLVSRVREALGEWPL